MATFSGLIVMPGFTLFKKIMVSKIIGVSSFFEIRDNWCQFIFRAPLRDNWCQFIFRAPLSDYRLLLPRPAPRARGEDAMPNRVATPSTQAGEPSGRPDRSESRTAGQFVLLLRDRSFARHRRLRSTSDGPRCPPTRANRPKACQPVPARAGHSSTTGNPSGRRPYRRGRGWPRCTAARPAGGHRPGSPGS